LDDFNTLFLELVATDHATNLANYVMQFIVVAAAFTLAAIVAYLFTPAVARLAAKAGAIDHPDGRRKCQLEPVPRGGGIIVTFAAIIGVAAAICFTSPVDDVTSSLLWRGLLPSLAILLFVGIIDDVLTLTGIYKLIGQVLAVSVLVAGGAQFDKVSLFGLHLPLGDLRIPFTMFFCLGAINAFNLIDGADALATSIGAVITLTLGIISCGQGDVASALVCFALAGALVGFLRYNISPARVYLGDTGSMMIGLVVAAVAIESSIKQLGTFVLAVPLALCAIPILDATAALIRRITTGQSVFTPDRGHLHHALLLRGWSVNKTVITITGITAMTCAGALASYFSGRDAFAIVISGSVLVTLAAARVFGHIEAGLIASHSTAFAKAVFHRGARRPPVETERAVQLQGRREWRNLWLALREAASTYNLTGLTLQIAVPHLHESFHAKWTSPDCNDVGNTWRITLPLQLDRQPIGKLLVVGSNNDAQTLTDIRQLLDFLEPIQGQIAEIIQNSEMTETPVKRISPDVDPVTDRNSTGTLRPVPGAVT
jgi:UDP-GlcNAc:undecaprenyl-phosphate GlcNAc-1-phosphate transferase